MVFVVKKYSQYFVKGKPNAMIVSIQANMYSLLILDTEVLNMFRSVDVDTY